MAAQAVTRRRVRCSALLGVVDMLTDNIEYTLCVEAKFEVPQHSACRNGVAFAQTFGQRGVENLIGRVVAQLRLEKLVRPGEVEYARRDKLDRQLLPVGEAKAKLAACVVNDGMLTVGGRKAEADRFIARHKDGSAFVGAWCRLTPPSSATGLLARRKQERLPGPFAAALG